METNESILTRSIVGLDERKVLGKMSSLRVDYDTQAVSHYIVLNASTNNAIALPFENAIATGDTFITVQSYGSFVDANSPAAKELVSDSNKLIGVEVYSRTGNTLGTVAGFDFDPVFGAIKSISLENGQEFQSEAFLFFAPDFVFVDDGSQSAEDLRQSADDAPAKKESAAAPATPAAAAPATPAAAEAPAANADGLSNEDALLVDFLVGKILNDDVTNSDDTFALPKGTEITREIALDAKKHDALLLLTMSVD
jgi:sporulation protein YlmC with PRC-barrel domain